MLNWCCCIISGVYNMLWNCRSEEEVQFEVWDQTLGFLPGSAPAHSILTLLWSRCWMAVLNTVSISHICTLTQTISNDCSYHDYQEIISVDSTVVHNRSISLDKLFWCMAVKRWFMGQLSILNAKKKKVMWLSHVLTSNASIPGKTWCIKFLALNTLRIKKTQ